MAHSMLGIGRGLAPGFSRAARVRAPLVRLQSAFYHLKVHPRFQPNYVRPSQRKYYEFFRITIPRDNEHNLAFNALGYRDYLLEQTRVIEGLLKGDVSILEGSVMWPQVKMTAIGLAEKSEKWRATLSDIYDRACITELTPIELSVFKDIVASRHKEMQDELKFCADEQEEIVPYVQGESMLLWGAKAPANVTDWMIVQEELRDIHTYLGRMHEYSKYMDVQVHQDKMDAHFEKAEVKAALDGIQSGKGSAEEVKAWHDIAIPPAKYINRVATYHCVKDVPEHLVQSIEEKTYMKQHVLERWKKKDAKGMDPLGIHAYTDNPDNWFKIRWMGHAFWGSLCVFLSVYVITVDRNFAKKHGMSGIGTRVDNLRD
eukprot:1049458_1